jgi:DNA phosphorothioation-dependent restriction protein DptH
MPEMTGCVVDVALGSSLVLPATTVNIEGQAILLRHLNEIDVERLLNPPSDETGGTSDPPPENPPPKPPAPRKSPDRAAAPAATLRKSSSTTVTKQPATQSKAGSTAEVILGTDRENQPVSWSPIIASNPHLMIAGLPGMGKTTCLINICRHLVADGVMPIVFSYHDDIDEKLGEAFPNLTLSDGRSLGFNPMRVTGDNDRAYIEVAGLLRDIFSAIFPDLGELQLEKIRNAIKASFEDHGWGDHASPAAVPPFRHFVELLRSQSKPDARTQTLLARLAELDDFGFFNAESAARSLLDADHPQVLRVHLSRSESLQRAYASFCFYSIYQDMFRRGRQDRITHAIIFDEAHRAAKLKLLPTMAKECRKYGLALIVASQETRDFDASLFSNIANYLILRVTDQDARAIARNVVPSEAQPRISDRLKGLAKYEALFFTESSRQPRHLKLSN